jgi:CheY-specific phosphatase CheX
MIDENQLRALIDLVWTTTLQLELMPGSLLTPAERDYALAACVPVTGAWQGAVVIECAPPLARRMAARLFQIEEHEATPADLRDALGEFTNIVTGNLKAQLPGPSALGLPTVAQGADFVISVLRSRRVSQAGFMCQGQPWAISVYERLAAETSPCCAESAVAC